MKREIKFRAKALDNKQWHEGYLSSLDTLNVKTIVDRITYYDEVLIDTQTIGQFTGLQDINGKDIYEGDIVKTQNKYGNEFKDYIFWSNAELTYMLSNEAKTLSSDLRLFKNISSNIEVVGNIHDNSELLKIK